MNIENIIKNSSHEIQNKLKKNLGLNKNCIQNINLLIIIMTYLII